MVSKNETAALYALLREAIESERGIEVTLLDAAAVQLIRTKLYHLRKTTGGEFASLSFLSGPEPHLLWIIRRVRYDDPFAEAD